MYPTGPSLMFYKLFLDEHVAASLKEYDALAVIEWDVLVAHSTSFSRLYDAAFSSEPFWVKGSTLAGTEFHQTAKLRDMWHVLGHLNGNALCESSAAAIHCDRRQYLPYVAELYICTRCSKLSCARVVITARSHTTCTLLDLVSKI